MTDYRQPVMHIGERRLTSADRASWPVVDPATGAELGRVPLATDADLADALAAADAGAHQWAATSSVERARVLQRTAGVVLRRRQELGSIITSELGKPTREALVEVDRAAELFAWAAGECVRSYGRVIPARRPGDLVFTTIGPVGPVVAISGWNAPAITPARKLAGALAAGCTVIVKPSEATPSTAVFLADALVDCGLPPGVLSVVFGEPAHVAQTLVGAGVARMMTFTGSTQVGTELAALATRTMKRMVLELGGHAPAVVFGDVDVKQVVRTAVTAKFRNSGQVCTSPTRFYIQRSIYNRFVSAFVGLTAALRVGDPRDPSTDMGPVQNPRRRDALRELVADARMRGATTATGGDAIDRPGSWFAPTVLIDVPQQSRIQREEPFGPIAVIEAFDDVEDAVAAANRTPFGLSSYVFGSDLDRVHRTVAGISAGTVSVNNWVASQPETPFGGVGSSGVGLEGGIEGLRAFQQIKVVSQSSRPA